MITCKVEILKKLNEGFVLNSVSQRFPDNLGPLCVAYKIEDSKSGTTYKNDENGNKTSYEDSDGKKYEIKISS